MQVSLPPIYSIVIKKDYLGYFIIYLYFKLAQWKKQKCNSLKSRANNQETSENNQ